MNSKLRNLPSDDLLAQTHRLVSKERVLTIQVIEHLEEIERRRLYLERGYPSLFEMCLREFKYSESQAHRRITAMRLARDIPEVKASIEVGSLSLATIAMAQQFFRQESKANGRACTVEQKREVLAGLENKSKREAERVLVEKSSSEVFPSGAHLPKETMLPGGKTRIEFVLDGSQLKKLRRIQALLSHQVPDQDLARVFDRMADLVLDKIDPVRKAKKRSSVKERFSLKARFQGGGSQEVSSQEVNSQEVNSQEVNSQEVNSQKVSSQEKSSQEKSSQEKSSQGEAFKTTPQETSHSTRPSLADHPSPNSLSPGKVIHPDFTNGASWMDELNVVRLTRYIPQALRSQVWSRAGSCCEYRDSYTGRRCRSKIFLQADHIIPYALGGATELENLQLLCRAHNQHRAIEAFGEARVRSNRKSHARSDEFLRPSHSVSRGSDRRTG